MNTQVHQQVKKKLFPHEDYDMPHPSRKHTISDISDLVSYPKRVNHNTPKEEARHTQTTINSKNIQTEDQPSTNQYDTKGRSKAHTNYK